MDYYLGLDIGTESVGWAATDSDYNLLRLKGKTAFGSRIFSAASDAKERRTHRSNRRRLNRRKFRIELLNRLFAEEINKVDNSFFARLAQSAYLMEDKSDDLNTKHLIFKTKKEESNFYKNYPTIWKLRKALINNESFAFSNIKHLYIALHHIIKYRGNFLTEGDIDFSDFKTSTIDRLNEALKNILEEDSFEETVISSDCVNEIKSILLDDDKTKSQKQKELKKIFNIPDDIKKYVDMFVSIVTGGKFSLSKFDKDFTDEIDFNKDFDAIAPDIESKLGSSFEIVLIAKEIFDFCVLHRLLGDNKYISDVMINIYEEHKIDLSNLKQLMIQIDTAKGLLGQTNGHYYNMFKKNKYQKKENILNNYCTYINGCGSGTKKCSNIDFYKYCKEVIANNIDVCDKEIAENILNRIEKGIFMRTSLLVSTSVIPHQLHLLELNKILDNAEKHFPFIKEIKEKLILLFKFRVPYFCGPLDNRSEGSNVDRKENKPIYPWNFKEIVDFDKTRQNFMSKLTNNCQYLFGKKVMPKVSLLYEEFIIRDRLNVMTINGNRLNDELRTKLYDFIISRSKTTIDNIKKYLGDKDAIIAGINTNDAFNANSHYKLGKVFNLVEERKLVEYLIYLATVYTDDRTILKEVINDSYPDLDENKLRAILTLQCKKWAPFSRELLEDVIYVDENGVASLSIIEVMRNTSRNFQMVLNDENTNFLYAIEQYNQEYYGKKTDEDIIQELLNETPALMRRSVNQTLSIIDDIVSITHEHPKKIFVEVTREDLKNKDKTEKRRRKEEVINFINSLIKDNEDCRELLQEAQEIDELKFKSRHLYLYFKQMGRDLYTGKRININDVLKSNKYDLDHIIPQSLIKDDSLDNLVLVDREYNQKIKSNLYPIPEQIRCNGEIIKLWNYLYKKELISKKKYSNLIRSTELTLDELEQFVARQINVVDYSNIVVKKILNIKYPNTRIVFSKAQYPHFVREYLKIAKNRDLNKAHHAVDAYLNVICGNILSTAFSNVRKVYEEIKWSKEKTFNMENVLKYHLKQNNLSDLVLSNSLRHDALITFKPEVQNGPLYKATLFKKGDGKLIPIHTDGPMSNTDKYGGYNELKTNRLCVVEYELKGKTIKKIVPIKTLYEKLYKQKDYELYKKLLVNELNATNIKIIKEIPLNQKVLYDGGVFLLWSSNEGQNKLKIAYQNYIDNDLLYYHQKCLKHHNSLKDNLNDFYDITTNRKEETFTISKEINYMVFTTLIGNASNAQYNVCSHIVKLRDINNKDKYNEFTLYDQININNILIRMLGGNESDNLNSFFSETGKLSYCRVSQNIDKHVIYLLHESPTGLYCYKEKINGI